MQSPHLPIDKVSTNHGILNRWTVKGMAMEQNCYFHWTPAEWIQKLGELERRVAELERRQYLFSQQPVVIQHAVFERLDAAKLEFKLDNISVQELNGTMNIGINRQKKSESIIEHPKTFDHKYGPRFIPPP